MAQDKRRSFSKEFKLKAVNWYVENRKNVSKPANKFQVDCKQYEVEYNSKTLYGHKGINLEAGVVA